LRKLIVFVVFLSFSKIQAQNQYVVDSLNQKLLTSVADTTKVMLLGSLAFEWQNNNPTKSLYYAQEALNLAQKINYKKGIGEGYHRTGNVYFTLGKYSKAMDFYYKALQIRSDLQDSLSIASTFNNIGICNQRQGDMAMAKKYLLYSLDIRKKLGNDYQTYLGYTNLANWYIAMEAYDSAILNLKIAKTFTIDENHRLGISYVNMKLGEVLFLQGEIENALGYFLISYSNYNRLNDNINGAECAILISKVYYEKKQLDSAIHYGLEAFKMSEIIASPMVKKNASEQLQKLYATKGDYENAYKFQSLLRQANDSLMNITNLRNIEAIKAEFEIAEREKELLQQVTKISRQRVTIFYFSIGVLILMAMMLALYINQRKIKAINKVLGDQRDALRQKNLENTKQKRQISQINSKLEELVEKRTRELEISLENLTDKTKDIEHFSYVLSHKVRSHVARIMGLVNLLFHMTEENRKEIVILVEKAVKELDSVLRDMDQVLNLQQGKKSIQPINIKFNTFIHGVLEKFNIELKELGAKIQIESDDEVNFISDPTYLENIMDNLISNAVKYRNPDVPLEIVISLKQFEDKLTISISDNGLGMDLNSISEEKLFRLFQRHHTHEHGRGLGLYLIKTQVEALGGDVKVESERLKGTTFYFSLPRIGLSEKVITSDQ
jgi:signal transduction histidine kinase